jgi:hypothetical protein
MRLRAMPRIGAPVTVAFLAVQIDGRVVAVDPDQRGLEVELSDGDRVRFELSRATGTFLSVGHAGARLLFE